MRAAKSRFIALIASASAVSLGAMTVAAPAAGAATRARPHAAQPPCNTQPTANGKWVCAVYETLLNRAPDSGGQSTWDKALAGGESRTEVADTILTSQEYRTDFIQADYQAYLGRSADSGGLNNLLRMFASGGTDEQVDAFILGSGEFYSKSGSTNSGFINAVYEDILGRPADSGGASHWEAALAQGQSRNSVAYAIDISQESRTDSVQFFYQAFLNRPADSGGLSHFLGLLNQGVTDEGVMAQILGSPEYFSDVTG